MVVNLQIKRQNLELIKAGTKKTEWRDLSKYNKDLLLKDRGDGKKDGNKDITHINFINGYSKNRETLTVEVTRIRVVKFTRNVEIPEDNFSAFEGQFSIEITLGNIVNN